MQEFLNTEMKATIEITGIYDRATGLLVKKFQLKYPYEIIKPSGLLDALESFGEFSLKKTNDIMGCK